MNLGVFFCALLVAGLIALWFAKRSRAATGVPTGRLLYCDTTRWQPVERPLFSHSYRLTGRPDYLVQRKRDVLIPVEVKSGRAPSSGPYRSHILQLASYCLLVEEEYGRRPPCGIIVYAAEEHQAYEIDYGSDLRDELLAILEEMECALEAGDAVRDHNEVSRCHACGYLASCDQSLA